MDCNKKTKGVRRLVPHRTHPLEIAPPRGGVSSGADTDDNLWNEVRHHGVVPQQRVGYSQNYDNCSIVSTIEYFKILR